MKISICTPRKYVLTVSLLRVYEAEDCTLPGRGTSKEIVD